MKIITPEVNPKKEFLEISNDFSHPLEIFREAISNAFDAKATLIEIDVFVDRSTGIAELVIEIRDNGHGVSEAGLKNFFGLGYSSRLDYDSRGNKISGSIGEKGHGTKIYFNSRKIALESVSGGIKTSAYVDAPIQKLRSRSEEMPTVTYETEISDSKSFTHLIIHGYNNNQQSQFSQREIKDYIYWFTKFGSCEGELGIDAFKDVTIKLKALDYSSSEPETLRFGHIFPAQNCNLKDLKKIDAVSPLEYYVAKWVIPGESVIDFPDNKIDIVFYLEGDKAKREYNEMIHKKYSAWRSGEYNVESRYGLWLCKDFIPIERHNEWVSEKTEWTKYHAFVNSQDISLTANRSDAGNTSNQLIERIGDTVKAAFQRVIESSDEYSRYEEEFQKYKQYRSAKKEEEDFARRKKAALQKKAAKYTDILLLEPRQEGGVFSIVTQLLVIDPNLFGFKVIDYDTSLGYDLLVSKDNIHDLSKSSMYFVEMKYILKDDFNHSFKKLATIICWDTNIPNDYMLTDLTGEKRRMRITEKTGGHADYTKYMLISDTESHNIEVIVLRDYLKERLSLDFRPRGEVQ
ncbi:MAG: hypothetical protein F9K24_12580 [Leptonema illini]|uniref:Histidine kinase-, DNA gyrase B-, and HSP90-like ATPase n=1 Tax=Leptonema illini TaxID=183 RepID=A0A833LWX8_9LEPT|nr:MAG: hypothetical protein F9K24_12580 [Leptonema illini]